MQAAPKAALVSGASCTVIAGTGKLGAWAAPR